MGKATQFTEAVATSFKAGAGGSGQEVGKRVLQAMAKARGLKPGGGEKCPGCPGEACNVVRLPEGGGSDGKKGRMFKEEWHCGTHGDRKRKAASRAKM